MTEFDEHYDKYSEEVEKEIESIDLGRIPLGYLLEECKKRSENYAFAFVDTNVNDEGSIVHFEIYEKFPGSMHQFTQALAQSSKECAQDYIVRTLQGGARHSPQGTSSPEEDDNYEN